MIKGCVKIKENLKKYKKHLKEKILNHYLRILMEINKNY